MFCTLTQNWSKAANFTLSWWKMVKSIAASCQKNFDAGWSVTPWRAWLQLWGRRGMGTAIHQSLKLQRWQKGSCCTTRCCRTEVLRTHGQVLQCVAESRHSQFKQCTIYWGHETTFRRQDPILMKAHAEMWIFALSKLCIIFFYWVMGHCSAIHLLDPSTWKLYYDTFAHYCAIQVLQYIMLITVQLCFSLFGRDLKVITCIFGIMSLQVNVFVQLYKRLQNIRTPRKKANNAKKINLQSADWEDFTSSDSTVILDSSEDSCTPDSGKN